MGLDKKLLKGMSVLIVDDHPANLDVLFKTLEQEGYKISVASDGEKALDTVSKSPPDLILLDVMMPGIDGFETCKRLKADPETADIPIIFITAKNETEDVVQGFSLGGVDYITKPIRQEEVCARVSTHLWIKVLMIDLEGKNKELTSTNDRLDLLNNAKTELLDQLNDKTSCLEQMNESRIQLTNELEQKNLHLEVAVKVKDKLTADLEENNQKLEELNQDLLKVNELNKKIMKES